MPKTKEPVDHAEALARVGSLLELIELAALRIGSSSHNDKEAAFAAPALGFDIAAAARIARELVDDVQDAINARHIGTAL